LDASGLGLTNGFGLIN